MGTCANVNRKPEKRAAKHSPVTIDYTRTCQSRIQERRLAEIESRKQIFMSKDSKTPILSLEQNKLYNQRISEMRSRLN